VSQQLDPELRAIRSQHIESLPARWSELEAAWLATPADTQTVLRCLHRMAGACGMFGVHEVSAAARAAEAAGQENIHDRHRMGLLLQDVKHAIDAATRAEGIHVESPAPLRARPPSRSPVRVAAARTEEETQRVAFLSPATAERFRDGLVPYQLEAVVLPEALRHPRPDVVLVVGTLQELQRADYVPTVDLEMPMRPRSPRVALIPEDDFRHRLQAVRAGAHGILVEPVSLEMLLERIDDGGRVGSRRARVLLIDDDDPFAQDLAGLLTLEGFDVTFVTEPADALDALREDRPDVVITDLHMPGCDGFELAAVIRQDATYLSIPILFLSADHRTSTHRAAMRQDGDAFVAKSEGIDTIVDVIRNKAVRSRKLEASITLDGLTGLLRHVPFKERMAEELSRAERSGTPLACCMVDIDRFKQVNDRHGHGVGDAVIRSLARLMKRRLRRSDVVGRYGGEEFAVCMPQTRIDEAVSVMDELREAFRSRPVMTGSAAVSVSFSAGVAAYSDSYREDCDALLAAADEALYRAKRGGRDQVRI
jgi:diguanylate cyclase (GGDEF)-like protein